MTKESGESFFKVGTHTELRLVGVDIEVGKGKGKVWEK